MENRSNLPEGAVMEEIDGVSHARFGNYGEQRGDGTAEISDEEMDREIMTALAEFVAHST